jgi:hypothetical protein
MFPQLPVGYMPVCSCSFLLATCQYVPSALFAVEIPKLPLQVMQFHEPLKLTFRGSVQEFKKPVAKGNRVSSQTRRLMNTAQDLNRFCSQK